MKITRVGVDIAKSVFHVHAVDRFDRPQWQAKLKRGKWLEALCNPLAPGAEVGMEACASAHHWGRELEKRGFRVRLIAAQFVKPYVKSNKNDRADAEAICEALGRPGMRFVTPGFVTEHVYEEVPESLQESAALIGLVKLGGPRGTLGRR